MVAVGAFLVIRKLLILRWTAETTGTSSTF